MILEIWSTTDRFFSHFGLFFALFPPPPPPHSKESKFWKNDYTLYCSWDMVCDGCNCCFSFWAIFCPFTLLTARKRKFQKKEKKPNARIYHHFTQVYQKSWSYTILFMRYGTWHMWFLFFILSHFLHFYSLTAQKMKTSRKWKKLLEIPSF